MVMEKTNLEETVTKFSFIMPLLFKIVPRNTIKKMGMMLLTVNIKFCRNKSINVIALNKNSGQYILKRMKGKGLRIK